MFVTNELHGQMKEHARKQGLTMTDFVTNLIEDELSDRKGTIPGVIREILDIKNRLTHISKVLKKER